MPDQAELAREAEAVLRERRGAGMVNVEVTDQAGTRRVLMVRFPRAKAAIGTGMVTVIVFGLPWLILPFYPAGEWWWPWAIVLVLALLFGWYLVQLLITAVRGGFLALTQTGVLIQTGLSLVLIPWTAISGTSADTDGTKARNPVLRLSLRSDDKVPGWPWPAALSPVLLGSSRRKLRILACGSSRWRSTGWWLPSATSPAIPKSARGSAARTLTSGSRPRRPRAGVTLTARGARAATAAAAGSRSRRFPVAAHASRSRLAANRP